MKENPTGQMQESLLYVAVLHRQSAMLFPLLVPQLWNQFHGDMKAAKQNTKTSPRHHLRIT
uniref:Uncharacterized protein n=1 Tax=Arundo donax TaxID=35708 RepID=A0A0A9SNZ7_ARUDO